jgi:hypothetical protein
VTAALAEARRDYHAHHLATEVEADRRLATKDARRSARHQQLLRDLLRAADERRVVRFTVICARADDCRAAVLQFRNVLCRIIRRPHPTRPTADTPSSFSAPLPPPLSPTQFVSPSSSSSSSFSSLAIPSPIATVGENLYRDVTWRVNRLGRRWYESRDSHIDPPEKHQRDLAAMAVDASRNSSKLAGSDSAAVAAAAGSASSGSASSGSASSGFASSGSASSGFASSGFASSGSASFGDAGLDHIFEVRMLSGTVGTADEWLLADGNARRRRRPLSPTAHPDDVATSRRGIDLVRSVREQPHQVIGDYIARFSRAPTLSASDECDYRTNDLDMFRYRRLPAPPSSVAAAAAAVTHRASLLAAAATIAASATHGAVVTMIGDEKTGVTSLPPHVPLPQPPPVPKPIAAWVRLVPHLAESTADQRPEDAPVATAYEIADCVETGLLRRVHDDRVVRPDRMREVQRLLVQLIVSYHFGYTAHVSVL